TPKGVRSQARHIQWCLEPGLIDGDKQAVIIGSTLMHEQLRRLSAELMPPCHIPEFLFWARFIRDVMQRPTPGRQPLLLRLQKLSIVPPRRLIREGTYHV